MKILYIIPNVGGVDIEANLLANYIRKLYSIKIDIISHWFNEKYIFNKDNSEEKLDSFDKLLEEIDEYDIIHSHTYTIEADNIDKIREVSNSNTFVYTPHSLYIKDFFEDPLNKEHRLRFNDLPKYIKKREIFSKKQSYLGKLQGKYMENAEKIICITKTLQNSIKEYYPELSCKTINIPNGTDFMKYNDDFYVENKSKIIRKDLVPKDEKMISYIGRLSEEKGVVDLAKAYNLIIKKYPNSKLIFAGPSDDEILCKISDEINEKSYNNVIYLGNIIKKKKIASLYRASDIIIVPSYYESFCLTAIESMSLKTPVVISDVDGPKELFINEGVSIGISPGDPESIYEGVNYIFSNPEETKKRVNFAFDIVNRKYNIKHIAKLHYELYDNLIA